MPTNNRTNWQTKNLDEVCEYIARGISPKYINEKGIFILNQKCVRNHEVSYKEARRHDNLNKKIDIKKLLQVGDILVNSTGTGTLGRVAQVKSLNGPTLVDSHITIVRPIKGLFEINFLGWMMIFIEDLIKDLGSGASGQTELSRSTLKEMQISYPESIKEQRRIVKILDEVFEKIEKAKENTEMNLKKIKSLFETYLNSVFANQEKNWEIGKLGNLTLKIGSGSTPRGGKGTYKTYGVSLVRSMNVHDRKFREENLAFIDHAQAKVLSNVILEENDVLLNITGASVARCCVFPEKYLPARVNQHVSIIRPKQEIIDAHFLNYLLTSQFYKNQLLKIGEQGATRQAITKTQLEYITVYFPKLSEQKSIVTQLNILSAETQKLEAIYKQKLVTLEELKKSVLKKAFAGEL